MFFIIWDISKKNLPKINPFKGTVERDFVVEFFHGSALYGAQISRLKGFRILFCIREVIRISQGFPAVCYSGDCEFPLKPTAAILNLRCSLEQQF
jgi:hypothetical protein